MTLTERDLDIVETLTCRVRVMSIRQFALLRWNGNAHSARRRLEVLVDAGILRCMTASANATQQAGRPLAEWSENGAEPDFEEIAQAASAVPQQSAEPSKVFFASRLTANLYASEFTTVPSSEDLNWQLRLGDAYLAFRTTRSTEASYWFNPSAGNIDESRRGHPDALIADSEGVPRGAVTTVKRSPHQLESAHSYCVKKGLSYELW